MGSILQAAHHTVFIALGSNLGNRLENLQSARTRLSEQVRIIKDSQTYETPPWGIHDQPAFLNQVLQGSTTLSPLKLLDFLKQVEKEMGREKSIRFGPRLIDLDILLYDVRQINTPRLTIPHKRMCERAFVLVPLAEIAYNLSIPGTERTVEEHLRLLDSSGIIQFDAL
jgi:2-amino-4-hydroxy-6-hydroxymethyldihydropteridine diphosphokinase